LQNHRRPIEGDDMKSEYEKLRESLPWTDEQIKRVLEAHGMPYGVDGIGAPWLSEAALAQLIELHRPS